jgi:hypothetical protein
MKEARVSLRIVRDPDPRPIPDVVFPDGRRSSSWEDFHAVRRAQRPDLYANL